MDSRIKPELTEIVIEEKKPEIIEYKTTRAPFGIGFFTKLKENLDDTSYKLRDKFDVVGDKFREPIDKIKIARLKKHHKLKEEDPGPIRLKEEDPMRSTPPKMS